MSSVLVSSASGAGVVRTAHGLLVTIDIEQGGGGYLRADDRYAPERAWGVGRERCAVGGLLPPGATRAEVIDELSQAHDAVVGNGAYIAEIGPASQMLAPVVCCRDGNGRIVRRPRGGDYPSVRVSDTQEPCPACGAIDWDEYTPTEQWRGGRGGPGGERIATPIVCCRVCGHEEREGTFFAGSSGGPADGEDEAAYARRLATARTRARHQRWLSDTMTIRADEFPIYLADGLPARVAGSAIQGEVQTQVSVDHYTELISEDPWLEQVPSLAITTAVAESTHHAGLAGLRVVLEKWINRHRPIGDWPSASHAAITLWIHARQRQRRAETLTAMQDNCMLIVDGVPTTAAWLHTADGLWAANLEHHGLLLTACGNGIEPTALEFEPLKDPQRLLGPEPPDA